MIGKAASPSLELLAEDRARFEAVRRAPSGSFPAETYTVGLSAGVQPVQKIATG